MNILSQVLGDWIASFGGTAAPASNLRDLWNQSSMSSKKGRILICYLGEKARGDFSVANALNRVDRQWAVAITRGRGYYSIRGDSLYKQGNAEIPLYDIVEQTRDKIRSILNISEELPTLDYKSIKPMQYGNLVIDGYLIEFSTANDIPFIRTSTENDGSGKPFVPISSFGIRDVGNQVIYDVGGSSIQDVGNN